jgi:hypothetical protein
MAQPTVNRFYKGLNSDMSLTDRSQDIYLDGHNIRLARREEGTLWAANIKGNEETFQLKENYVPIGSVEFDGFLFIFSVNPSNSSCEIGSYPSPDPATNEITRTYRPLKNYSTQIYIPNVNESCVLNTIDSLIEFNTFLLGFRCDKPLRVEARLDFDGSVNLYWTDDNLPWRGINTGFVLKTGIPNNRYVTSGMIQSGYINGINENTNHPIVDFQTYGSGNLKVGNYFFFARYTDLTFLTTSFLGQSGPVPLFINNNAGAAMVTSGGESDDISSKSVNLSISGLDINIPFIEIGYIRYFGQDVFECFLIDKRYSINGNTQIGVNITGNEPLIALTIDELVLYKPSDALYCKDIAQAFNTFFLANTRGPVLDHPDLRRFMCALTLSESYTNNGPAGEIRTDVNNNPYSIDGNDTEEKVGYFSGETYCFSVIPVFKGGFTGLPYPITGYDNYLGMMSNSNNQGMFRFRRYFNAPAYDGTNTFIKGINVNTSGAATIYNASIWLQENLEGVYVNRAERKPNLLFQGLSLRCYNGKMNPNPQKENYDFWWYSQGIGTGVAPTNGAFSTATEEDWHTDRLIPLFEPATYMFQSQTRNAIATTPFFLQVEMYKFFHYARPYNFSQRNDFVDPNSLAIFSTDYYIGRENVPDNSYVEIIATTQYSIDWNRESSSLNPIAINNRSAIGNWKQNATDPGPILPFWENYDPVYNFAALSNKGVIQTFLGYNQNGLNVITPKGFNASCLNITGWTAVPNSRFVSRFDEGKIASQDGLYYYEIGLLLFNGQKNHEISLPVATPDYVAITNAPAYIAPYTTQFNHFVDEWNRSIVNTYIANPNTVLYTDFYDFKNTEFYPIGKFQNINDFLASPQHTYYRGDCVVSRTYLKLQNASNENLSQFFYDVLSNVEGISNVGNVDSTNAEEAAEALQKGYGHWVSVVTENKYNPSYRYELGRNYFYPKTNPLNPGIDFAWIYDSPESFFYNKGMSEYLGPRAGVGIDLLQPLSDNRFPTRIRPSLKHIFGAVRDGYRQFVPADAKDFDYEAGEIQALAVMFDYLYSFQNRAINLHPINERVTQQSTSGSTAILGQSTGLTEYRQVIKRGYGTQHRFGVIKANQALYCIDWNKRAILRVAGGEVQMLDVEKGVQSWFRRIVALGSTGYSDALEVLPNAHTCGLGIHGVYNRKYKEVIWTLKLGEDEVKTIAFSEEMDTFLGTHGYKPNMYAQVEEDLYSFVDNKAWLHDVKSKYDNFYNLQDVWKIKVSVAEGAEITKHYDNIVITSNNRVFSAIKFETQHQTAEQRPFQPTNEFWYAPTYRENEWRLPIRRADNIKEPELNIYDDFGFDKTPMRGRYLIVELEYDGDKELWVRELMTYFNLSFA